jgi:hypothetical protein
MEGGVHEVERGKEPCISANVGGRFFYYLFVWQFHVLWMNDLACRSIVSLICHNVIRQKEMIKIYSPNDELELSMIRGIFDTEGVHYFVRRDRICSALEARNPKLLTSKEDTNEIQAVKNDSCRNWVINDFRMLRQTFDNVCRQHPVVGRLLPFAELCFKHDMGFV